MTDDVIDYAAIRALAKLAREDTFRPGWPYQGSGEWTENVIGMLGGHTGNFAGAMSPDVVVRLLDRVEELEAERTRVREAMWEAHAHRFDLDDTATVGPGKPAGGPDIFYNGVSYVVRRIRAALAAVPAAGEETC